jgi:hypothetical protein
MTVTADWRWLINRTRQMQASRGGPYLETVPVVTLPCELVLSGKHGSNGRVLLVRCRCQAQCRNAPRANFWGYDPLGEAAGLGAAVKMWREHRAGMTELEESA